MKNHLFLPTALLAVTTFAGCSFMPEKNAGLNEARNDYSAAQNDPQVNTLAQNELNQAGEALDKANKASKEHEDAAMVTHLAYLAKQRTAIAKETAKQKEAETAVANAGAERSNIRLAARTEEANKAHMNAAASDRQATASQQEAAASQQQARDSEARNSQLEAQLKELNAKKTERGMVITLGDVLFDTNKADLKPGGTRNLQKLAEFLKKNPLRYARIEGYTDSTGNTISNLELSERRADAVRSSLVDMGIGGSRITTQGFGQDSPVAGNDTASGRQMNRRVEIVLSNDNNEAPSR